MHIFHALSFSKFRELNLKTTVKQGCRNCLGPKNFPQTLLFQPQISPKLRQITIFYQQFIVLNVSFKISSLTLVDKRKIRCLLSPPPSVCVFFFFFLSLIFSFHFPIYLFILVLMKIYSAERKFPFISSF